MGTRGRARGLDRHPSGKVDGVSTEVTSSPTHRELGTAHAEAPLPPGARNDSCPDACGEPDARTIAGRCVLALLVLITVMLTLGGVGNVLVFDGPIGRAEADAVGWIADNRVRALDTAATVGSSLSDTWTVIGVLFGAVMMLLATGHRRCATLLLAGITLEFVTFLVVGTVIDRSRPEVETLHSVPSTSSFPSGHVAGALVLYGSLTLVARVLVHSGRVPRATWILPLVAVVIVGSSRVYEGVHFPTDVVAGLVLGLGALVGAGWATGFIDPRDRTIADAPASRR